MVVSMVVFYYMKKYKDVTFGSCDALNDGIISQCKTMSKNCIGNGQHSIYNVYFRDLNLDGPFWIQSTEVVFIKYLSVIMSHCRTIYKQFILYK